MADIATIQPSAQAIERDNRSRKEQRMEELRQTLEMLIGAEGWSEMLRAEALRCWPITRVVVEEAVSGVDCKSMSESITR